MVEHLFTKSVLGIALAVCAVTATANADPSKANSSKEKAGWYSAPPELQVLDDRPVIKECRQPPQEEKIIEIRLNGIPNGSGTGWVEGDRVTLRGSVGEPKSGFGRERNVCADRSIALPSGLTTNRLMEQLSLRQRGKLLRRS